MSRHFAELTSIVEALTDAELGQLTHIAQALATPIDADINFPAGLVTVDFGDEFQARLKAHHGTHTQAMDRLAVEDAIRASSIAAGRTVGDHLGRTHPYFDEVIDGENVAIKTTAAKSVRTKTVHISKLCEAAWIQDVRGALERMNNTKSLLQKYLDEVDQLLQLRVLPDTTTWHYQLVEVPMTLFKPILSLKKNDFAPDGPRIAIKDARGDCLTLVLDRSDSKVTITKIPISRCIVHGEWKLPKSMFIEDA